MRRRAFALLAVSTSIGLVLAAERACAESAPIVLDGFLSDWTGPVEHVDPAGDGVGGGVDIRALDLANDGENLFIRFDLTVEVGLQETNNLVLYLDTDQNAATGRSISGIGAELEWRFGARQGTFYRPAGSVTVFQDDLRLRELPSITAPVFELAIGRDVRPDGSTLLFPGAGVRVLLRHEVTNGDQAPNVNSTLTYLFDATVVPPADPIALGRQLSTDVRFTCWNVVNLEQNGGGWNAAATPAADRVLSAIDPDVLCFEEIYDNSAAATAALVETFLPSGAGEAWYSRENSDVKVVSRFPVLGTWFLNGAAGDRNLGVLLDTQAALGRTTLVVGNHLFCCTNNAGRQQEVDRIMAFFRDAKTPGGTITVPDGTMLLVTGDLNLVGFSQQLRTLLQGDIVDEATFGADFLPDWDATPFADLVTRQSEKRFAYTWRNDSGSFAPGRLDFFIYSDAVVEVGNHFILYTPEMSATERAPYGLQPTDVTLVSDHLPHTADFRPRTPVDVASQRTPAHTWASMGVVGMRRGRAELVLGLERPAQVRVEVFDVRGARVAVLQDETSPELGPGSHRLQWNGRRSNGERAPSGVYVARLVAQDADGAILATSTKFTLVR